MHAHPEDSKLWHVEFVKELPGEKHVVKVAVNMDGIAKNDDMVEHCANDHEEVE